MATQFSTLQFFTAFQNELKRLNAYPLTLDNLIIHKDNLAHIGDDESSDLRFAHLGIDFPTSQSVLLFAVDFFREGIQINIGGMSEHPLDYDQLGTTEAKAAKTLIALLKALSNGQIALLNTCTEDTGAIQAVEVLYKDKTDTRVLITYPAYEPTKQLKDRLLDFNINRNSYDFPMVPIDPDFLISVMPSQEFPSFNRTLVNNTLSPLTREEWESNIEQHYQGKADEIIAKVNAWGAPPDASFKEQYWHYAQKRHVSLAVVASVVSAIFTLTTTITGVNILLTAIAIACAITLFWLRKKHWRIFVAKLLAYPAAICVGLILYLNEQSSGTYVLAVILVAIEVVECIVLDIITAVRDRNR